MQEKGLVHFPFHSVAIYLLPLSRWHGLPLPVPELPRDAPAAAPLAGFSLALYPTRWRDGPPRVKVIVRSFEPRTRSMAAGPPDVSKSNVSLFPSILPMLRYTPVGCVAKRPRNVENTGSAIGPDTLNNNRSANLTTPGLSPWELTGP